MDNFNNEQQPGSRYNNFDTEPKINLRQRDKLVAVLTRNDPTLFQTREVTLDPDEQKRCLSDIFTGMINSKTVTNSISRIRASHQESPADQIFTDMESYEKFGQIKGMIAVATSQKTIQSGEYDSAAFKNRDAIKFSNLRTLIEIYQNPADLEIALHSLMKQVQKNNPPEKFAQYQKSLRVLLHAVYGKRAEYWEQYKLLYREAYSNQPEPTSEKNNLISNEGSIPKSNNQEGPDNQDINSRKNDEIDAERVAKIIPMIVSAKKIPLITDSEGHIHLFSIPENPQITDQQAEKIIRSMGQEIKKLNPEIVGPIMKNKLLSTFQPSTYARFEGTETADGFNTKNSIYRVLITHVNHKEYFENI